MGMHELAVAGLVGSGLGALLGAPLVWPRVDRRTDLTAFGAATVLLAFIAGLISARLAGLVPGSVWVSHAINLAGLAAFECALLYVRTASGAARPAATRIMTPLVIYGCLAAISARLGHGSSVPFSWLLPLVLSYTATGMWLLRRRSTSIDRSFVPPEWVVGFMALVNVAQITRMDLAHVPQMRAVVPLVMLLGFAAIAVLVSFRVARTLAPVPAGLLPSLGPPVAAGSDSGADGALASAGYTRSGLDDRAARELLQRIEQTLDRDRLFARPDLSLTALARAVHSTPHLVSEALNRVGGTSFREVVTRRRVADVKAQLEDAASDRYTIEGIGTSAGFGSRSALYEAFKRWEGTTPTAYRDTRRRARS